MSSLRCYSADVCKVLKVFETVNNVHASTLRTESWSFILSIVIYYDLLFEIKKTSKLGESLVFH